jgi:hypothetical protein
MRLVAAMERNQPPPYAELPLPDLLKQLSSDVATLVRQEIQLARAELSQKGKTVAASGVGFGVAAVLGLGAFGALTSTIIALLSVWLPVWIAALIVTIVYGVGATVGAISGKKALSHLGSPVPESVASVKDDVAVVAAGIRRAR